MIDVNTVVEDFRSELSLAGIIYTGPIETGKLKRFNADNEKGLASWYVLHVDGIIPAGKFGCWRRGIAVDYKYSNGHSNLSPEQWDEVKQKWKKSEADKRTAEEKRLSEAKIRATQILSAAVPATPDHPYLRTKRIGAFGEIRVAQSDFVISEDWILPIKDCLIIPLRDFAGTLHTLEFIAPDKRFGKEPDRRNKELLFGGDPKSHFYVVSETGSGPVIVCEGYATGASIAEATGWSVYCARNANNLSNVAAVVRKQFPSRSIIVAADNDRFTRKQPTGEPWNPGEEYASAAAKSVRGTIALPVFSDEDTKSTDFNDLAITSGLDAVLRSIRSAMPLIATPIGNLVRIPENQHDPTEILRYRYLCRKMALLFVGPTGKGKSSAVLQALACWSVLRDFFGIVPALRIRAVYIQAENDEDDIAAVRDGICTGLNFSEEERRIFFENVMIYTEMNLTGKRFCNEVVKPLVEIHKADIVAIDPVLSYLGGDSKEQNQVGLFLRNYLAPVLADTNCAAFINHHTNKIAAFDTNPEKTARDFAYFGSGSSEWANWPRAILALEPTKTRGVFRLHAAKRGQKLRWTQEMPENKADKQPAVRTKDQPELGQIIDIPSDNCDVIMDKPEIKHVFSKLIGHSKDNNTVYWRSADESEVPSRKGSRSIECSPEELTSLLKGKKLSSSDWQDRAKCEFGISRATFFRIKKIALSQKLVSLSPIDDKWMTSD